VVVEWGITAAGLLVVLMLIGVAVIDVVLEYGNWRTIGDRLRAWSGRYPFLASAFALLLGAILSHFFWRTGP
jgi:hypothetical protein